MRYIDTIENQQLKAYFEIFCDEYPTFIDKYINSNVLQRLAGVGQFCGCDYTQLFSCRFWYSRLDHSITCALMTYHFTKSKEQTLAALFHDLGTPAFSHTIDFLLGESEHQNASERNVKDIILSSTEIMQYLEDDEVELERVLNLEIYPIVENEKPKICVDRLDGILHTCFIWVPIWELKEIKTIFDDLIILKNEDGKDEIGFQTKSIAELFYEGAFHYSILLQENEDKFVLQYLSDVLKRTLEDELFEFDDFYKLSEKQIIEVLEMNE